MITPEQLKGWRDAVKEWGDGPYSSQGSQFSYENGDFCSQDDLDYMTVSRVAMPLLLDEVERLQKELEARLVRIEWCIREHTTYEETECPTCQGEEVPNV